MSGKMKSCEIVLIGCHAGPRQSPRLLTVACTARRSPASRTRKSVAVSRRGFQCNKLPVAGCQLPHGKLPYDKTLSIQTIATAGKLLAEKLTSGTERLRRCE